MATIGPASEDRATLRGMIAAGMNMARLSLAHGPLEETLVRMEAVRRAAADEGATIGILADLPGPKIRAALFPEDGVHLGEGQHTELVPGTDGDGSNSERIAIDQPELLAQLRAGDKVALGDGGISLVVDDVHGDRVRARVVSGGQVLGRPGVTLPAARFQAAIPTPEDLRLLAAVCEAGVDAVAISFVRAADDVERVRAAAGPDPPMLVAKIETPEAVNALEALIAASDGVMVARGDLGIRCALEEVPHFQKLIIRTGVAFGRPVITATQML